MASSSEPSDFEREIWMRNRIIEYLEVASSFVLQCYLEYKMPVPHEMIIEWESLNPVDQSVWPGRLGPPYSDEEIEAMQRFHTEWEWVCDHTPNPLPWGLDVVHGWPEWERLRAAAEETLTVFERRGKLPEWSGQEPE